MLTQSQRRGESTRQEIIQAAHDLFVSQGYHGTSMRQIAQNAGIALGSVYNHFAGKEDVFKEVFLAYHPFHEVIPAITAAKGDDVEQFVRDAFDRSLTALEHRPYLMNLMFIEVVEFKSIHVQELFTQLLPDLMEIIQRVIESNFERLRPISPWILMRGFFGLLFSYFLTENMFVAQVPKEFREDAVNQLVDIFLYGVLNE